MSLKDKMVQMLDEFDSDKHRIKEYFTVDNNSLGKSRNTTLIPEGREIQYLSEFIGDFEKYGEVAGFDGKGYKVTITDLELIIDE